MADSTTKPKLIPAAIGLAVTAGVIFVIFWAASKGWKSAS